MFSTGTVFILIIVISMLGVCMSFITYRGENPFKSKMQKIGYSESTEKSEDKIAFILNPRMKNTDVKIDDVFFNNEFELLN